MSTKVIDSKIEDKIIKIIESEQQPICAELLEIISTELNMSKEEVIKIILILEDKEKIKFINIDDSPQMKLSEYLLSRHSYWYLSTVILSIITILSIFIFPSNQSFYLYIRYILGSFFTMFLPGYCISKILYIDAEIEKLKLIVLSIGISISLSSIIGIILNYTPWGINLVPLMITYFILILFFSTIGIIREYNNKSVYAKQARM